MGQPRHHITPEWYLTRFAAKGKVTMVPRQDAAKKIPSTPNNAGSIRNFYAVQLDDGTLSQAIETKLSQIEGAAAPVAELLATEGPAAVAAERRDEFALFLSFQLVRDERSREAERQLLHTMSRAILHTMPVEDAQQRLAEIGEPSSREDAEEFLSSQRAALDSGAIRAELHQNDAIATMLRVAPTLVPFLSRRRWAVFRFPVPVLLTSDHPVALLPSDEPTHPLAGVGVANAGDIRFPLDARHLLVMSRVELAERLTVVPPGYGGMATQVRATNEIIAHNAHRWIFHRPDHDPLDGITLKPHAPFATMLGEKP